MMSAYFLYPEQAKFGRIVAKSKIYERANPSKKVQDKFVSQVERIIWQYKLAPKTTNLPETKSVKEIEVFEIALKSKEIDLEILKSIDRSVIHPIIFHLTCDGQVKVVATHKRPNEADEKKWVVGNQYFETSWMPKDVKPEAMPTVLNLAALYEELLKRLLPIEAAKEEKLEDQVARTESLLAKEKEYARLETRMNREKQFNRKVELNAQLRDLEKELKDLKQGKGNN